MRWAKRFAGILLWLFIGIPAFLQTLTPVYRFPSPQPFQGKGWYNPFGEDTLVWQRANFHIHSRTWGGITNGYQSPPEIHQVYDSLGYRWFGIADYQRINPHSPIPVYEHGWSIGKVHQLCFWPKGVLWWDYPFFQTLSAKQHTLRLLRPTTPFLVIAHPRFHPYHTYTGEELARLGGYDAIEVLNRYGDSIAEWDSALSSGHYAPIIGSDNAHNVRDPHQVMSRWFEIAFSDTASVESLREALLNGRTVGYKNRTAFPLANDYPRFTRIVLKRDTLFITLSQVVDSVRVIGQHGKVRAVAFQTQKLVYPVQKEDTYLRVEAYTAQVEMYASPLVQGPLVRRSIPPIDWGWTLLHALVWGGITVGSGWLGFRLFRSRRDTPALDKSPVLPPE